MSINFRPVRGLRQHPLLACVVSHPYDAESAMGPAENASRNVRKLVKLWEAREAPYTCVRAHVGALSTCESHGYDLFRAGDLVFDTEHCSMLRNRKFLSFYYDIGAPPIIMIGASLESTIIGTSIDAYWSDIHLTVVRDAVLASHNWKDVDCHAILKALSNFVDIVDTEYVEND